MRMISGLTLLLFGLLAPAQTPSAAKNAPAPPPQGVWTKLDQTLNTSYTRAGDKISLVMEDEVTVKNVQLPKGTKLTGTVMKSVSQDKTHPNSGFVLVLDTAVLKDGTKIPVKVTMDSIAPSHSDEVEKIELGSGAGAPGGTSSPTGGAAVSSPIASRSTDANWIAATIMGTLSDPNVNKTARSSNEMGGIRTTSSIMGVTLIASPTANSSGAVLGIDSPLQLTKWTRINVLVSPQQ